MGTPGLESCLSVQLHHEAGAQRESLLPGIGALDVSEANSSILTFERPKFKEGIILQDVELTWFLDQVGFKGAIGWET